MKTLLSVITIVAFLLIQANSLSVQAVDCTGSPNSCGNCVEFCSTCDQPATWTCTQAAAAADGTHPCNSWCI